MLSKTCDYFEKKGFHLVPHDLNMTAEEFFLIPKHLYVIEEPHAAHVLHDRR